MNRPIKYFFFLSLFSILNFQFSITPVHASANPTAPCPIGESRYRPGGDCEKTVPSVYSNTTYYPLTCQDVPLARLDGTSLTAITKGTVLRRTITADISLAEVGGLGPNPNVLNTYSDDSIAQIYPFNGLFDKPLYITNQPREASRTYWRLMSTYQQANAKAAYFNLVLTSPFINNTTIGFHNPLKTVAPPPVTPTPTPPPTNTPQKIVLLGDSITAGYYSCSLRSKLPSNYTFVGSQTTANGFCSPSVATEGYGGYATTQILNNGIHTKAAALKADVAFIHLGTNDIADVNFNAQISANNISTMVNTFKAQNPNIRVIVAQIITSKPGSILGGQDSVTRIQQLNNAIAAIPNATILNLFNSINPATDLVDDVHPNFNGGEKMANLIANHILTNSSGTNPTTLPAVYSANDSIDVITLANRLPGCLRNNPVCDDFAAEYLNLPPEVQSAYDALLPFNFDNVRGYQVLNGIIYKEGLAFVQAINDGLTDDQSGLLNLLSPQWLNDYRRQPGNKSILVTDSANHGSNITSLQENPAFMYFINERSKQLNSLNDCFNHDDATYLPAPQTYPVGPAPLSQKIDLTISNVTKELDEDTNRFVYHYTSDDKRGTPIAVVNNPKLRDLNLSLKGPQSLYAMFVPSATTWVDRDLVAPVSKLSADGGDTKVDGETFEPGMARIGRTGGHVQTSLCQLRNEWLIPDGLQKPYIDCIDPFQTLIKSPKIDTTGSGTNAGTCTLPTSSFDSTVRAAIQRMHSNPSSNAYKVPLELLYAIYEIESFPYFTGAKPYVCEDNEFGAAGPFQIVKTIYNGLTCESERIADDLAVCTSTPGKLSRCSIDDNVELAARVLLFSAGKWVYGPGNCSATGGISVIDKATIYRATNNYYGSCRPDAYTSPYRLRVPLPAGQVPNYGDIVLDKMGLVTTSSDYPQPQCP